MAKSGCKIILPLALFLAPLCQSYAAVSHTIQIHTHFTRVIGSPTWIVIIHDMDSSAVYPYLFNIIEPDNFFLIFPNAKNYYIVSILQFDFLNKKIENFCHLSQGMMSGVSMDVTLKGTLTPNPSTSQCYVLKYKDMPYTVSVNK